MRRSATAAPPAALPSCLPSRRPATTCRALMLQPASRQSRRAGG